MAWLFARLGCLLGVASSRDRTLLLGVRSYSSCRRRVAQRQFHDNMYLDIVRPVGRRDFGPDLLGMLLAMDPNARRNLLLALSHPQPDHGSCLQGGLHGDGPLTDPGGRLVGADDLRMHSVRMGRLVAR